MRNYQLVCTLPPKMKEEEITSLQNKVISLLQKNNGIFFNLTRKRGFVNQVLIFQFQTEPENLSQIEKAIKSEKDILYHMIVLRKIKGVSKVIYPKRITSSKDEIKDKSLKQKVEIGEIDKKLEEILNQ